jgi:P27 family predicted phage terminase small subunit
MKNSDVKPPKSLSTDASTMWKQLQTEYQIIDKGGLIILTAACESFDRMCEARALVENEGMTIEDRFGQKKPHPAVIIERDARAAMLAAVKQLNLDLEPLKAVGRPSNSPHWKG